MPLARATPTLVQLALCIALGACARAHPAMRPAPAAAPAARATPGEPERIGDVVPGQQAADRLLVRRAALGLRVKRVEPVAARAAALAQALGGYVQSSRTTSERSVDVTLRIPGPALEPALDSLALLGRVTARTVSADDVTERVVDLEARLGNLVAVRDRLRQHLDRAAGVSDVLVVERELARVQGEIDALEARLKHLRGSAALAELTVHAEVPIVLGPLGVVALGLGRALGWLFVIR